MKKIIMFFAFAFIFSFANYAQLDRSVIPAPGPAPKIMLGDYKMFRLENGLKVIVVENNKLPVVSFSLSIERDPILEGNDKGYTGVAGQLLRTGTTTRSKIQLDKEIDFIGADVSTSATGIDASSLKKHADKLLELVSDILMNPSFSQTEFDRIIKQNKSGLTAEKDNPGAIAGKVFAKILYGKEHPYSESTTEATLDNVTLDMCKDYYGKFFKPDNAYLTIVGNVTEKEAKKMAEKYFGKWAKGATPSFTYPVPAPPVVTKVAIVDRDNSVQSTIRVGHVINLKVGSEDEIKARVANTILGGGTFRLFNNLREKHAYTYGAYSSLVPDKLIGKFIINTEVRNEVTDSAVIQILSEIKKMRDELVPDKELQTAKNYLSGSFAISLENPKTIANFAVNIDKYNLPKDYYANYLQKVAMVTPEDIKTVSKKYLLPDQETILVIGKASEIADKLKKFTLSKIDYYDNDGNKYDPNALKVPEGVTAQTVIDKYIAAIGGLENLKKVKDRKTTMSGSIQGQTLTMEQTQKAPNKFLQVVKVAGMEQKVIFNGKAGFQSVMGQTKEIPAEMLEDIKIEAAMDFIYNLDGYGIKATLAGLEKYNGKEACKIEFSLPSGKKWSHLYDAATGFKLKENKTMKTPQGEIPTSIEFDDYKEVDGVKYPFKYTQAMAGQNIVMTVSEILVNKGVPDQDFEK
jgi:predicted Zn-dependent peptidase/phosphotransferase system IIB component